MIINWTTSNEALAQSFYGMTYIANSYGELGAAPAYYGVLKAYHPVYGWLPVYIGT
jgi:hypothetical protein